jgi:alkaline phosphatase D
VDRFLWVLLILGDPESRSTGDRLPFLTSHEEAAQAPTRMMDTGYAVVVPPLTIHALSRDQVINTFVTSTIKGVTMGRADRERDEIRRRIREKMASDAERLVSRRSLVTPDAVRLNRRTFLMGSAAYLLLPGGVVGQGTPITTPAEAGIDSDPFTLGIASGEPEPDGVVLWTRMAPDPFEENGGVGVASVAVAWEVASDEGMTDIVQQGVYATDAGWAHSIHVEVTGLEPSREYWYRFRFGDFESAIGRTKTSPAPGDAVESFRFAFASCQRWEHGLYTAFRDMAAEMPDLIIHLGDYIYEYGITMRENLLEIPARSTDDIPGRSLEDSSDLEGYRHRYAIYKRDADLQEAHRIAPWLVTWDDHEVANDFYGALIRDFPYAQPLLERRTAAYQAYWEHQPLRERSRPNGPDLQLYRSVTFGDLIRFNVLDTRQYRSPQIEECFDTEREFYGGYCLSALDPARTMLGAQQKQWLFDGFGETETRWNVLAQQVGFSRVDLDGDSEIAIFGDSGMDTWDGYVGERQEVIGEMADAAAQQGFHPVVLTGDVHRNFVWDIKRDWDAPGSETAIGTELVGTSIASNGDDPLEDGGSFRTICGGFFGNEHNHLYDNHRGYVLVDVSREQLEAAYRVVSTVEKEGGSVTTLTSFVMEQGRLGAQVDQTCQATMG